MLTISTGQSFRHLCHMFPQIFVRNLVTQETPTNPLRTCLKVFVPVQIKLKFGSVGFLGRGNRSTLRKSSWRKSGNQQQTQSTYCDDTGKGTQGVSLKRGVGVYLFFRNSCFRARVDTNPNLTLKQHSVKRRIDSSPDLEPAFY